MINVLCEARDLRAANRDQARTGQPNTYWKNFARGLKEGHLSLAEFSIRELFEHFVPDGREIVDSWNPRHGGGGVMLSEAGDAVKTGDFSNITGQLLVNQTLEAFQDPGFLFPLLMNDVQTSLNGEKIPGITRIGDEAQAVGEAQQYPLAGIGEEFVETPTTTKRGMIVPLTKEAVFFDLTNLLVTRASEVGYWLGQNKEKRCLNVALGVTNNYKRNGTADNSYANTHNTGDFDNLGVEPLVDWTDIEEAELLFDAITDPNTGEPISIIPNTLVVPTALKHTANRIKSATEIRFGIHGDTSASSVATSSQPTGGQYTIVTGPMVSVTVDATSWFIGDFKRAFVYMQNWPITAVQAPTNAEAEFQQDIVMQHKVSERGVAAVREPRYVAKMTAS